MGRRAMCDIKTGGEAALLTLTDQRGLRRRQRMNDGAGLVVACFHVLLCGRRWLSKWPQQIRNVDRIPYSQDAMQLGLCENAGVVGQ